jgi:hypothetical protein
MSVLPAAKWSGNHYVAEHPAGFAGGVLGGPGLRDGAYPEANFDERSWLIDSSGLFDDVSVFPGGTSGVAGHQAGRARRRRLLRRQAWRCDKRRGRSQTSQGCG